MESYQAFIEQVRFDKDGLVPVIAQDAHAKKVRMLAYMNKEALTKTLETGKVHYYSRSRQNLWLKGETSGHFQYLKGMSVDCDGDTLLIQIEQEGGISCHTGHATCFYTTLAYDQKEIVIESKENTLQGETMLEHLYEVALSRKEKPKEGSYTNYLFEQGENKILKKVGEEASEIIIAAKDNAPQELVGEVADFLYHLNVLLVETGVTWEDLDKELRKRA